MQDTKTRSKKENRSKNKRIDPEQDFFLSPIPIDPNPAENNKPSKNFLGKKLSGDAELISWLSGIEMNNKNLKDEEGLDENNSKIKKKLRNKLIKNAKKCELYFIHRYPDDECIEIQCAYCLKKFFNQNELIRFINFDDFAFYLKYIFYLSDKVICYSINDFKSNKKSFDILFSKFKKKEEKWNFNQEKIICKLCMFKLINKPDFIKKIKNIFLHGENEKSYNMNYGDIIIELNSEDNKNKSNFIVKKIKNNDINKNKIQQNKNKKQINYININKRYFFPSNNYNNPNCLNIFNSNNININIKNNNKIINNLYSNNNSFLDLCEKVKSNDYGLNNINPNQINFYWQQLFYINFKKVISSSNEIKKEIINLRNFIINIINNDNKKQENSYYENGIIQNSRNRTILLLNEIMNYIKISDDFLNVFLNDLNNYSGNYKEKNILIDLISNNRNNFNKINQIIQMYIDIVKYYIIILNRN